MLWGRALVRLAGAFAIAYAFRHFGSALGNERLWDIAQVLATLGGTLLGFVLTAVAILTAVLDRTLVKNLRMTGHYQRFVTEALATCMVLLALTVIAVATLFAGGDALIWCMTIAIFFASLATFYSFETGQRFLAIVRHL